MKVKVATHRCGLLILFEKKYLHEMKKCGSLIIVVKK